MCTPVLPLNYIPVSGTAVFYLLHIPRVQGCVSQRYSAFALHASSYVICYNFRRCHGYMLAMPHISHSIRFSCQLMRTPLVYKVLATTLILAHIPSFILRRSQMPHFCIRHFSLSAMSESDMHRIDGTTFRFVYTIHGQHCPSRRCELQGIAYYFSFLFGIFDVFHRELGRSLAFVD